jgi:hypothetical protein
LQPARAAADAAVVEVLLLVLVLTVLRLKRNCQRSCDASHGFRSNLYLTQ